MRLIISVLVFLFIVNGSNLIFFVKYSDHFTQHSSQSYPVKAISVLVT